MSVDTLVGVAVFYSQNGIYIFIQSQIIKLSRSSNSYVHMKFYGGHSVGRILYCVLKSKI